MKPGVIQLVEGGRGNGSSAGPEHVICAGKDCTVRSHTGKKICSLKEELKKGEIIDLRDLLVPPVSLRSWGAAPGSAPGPGPGPCLWGLLLLGHTGSPVL